LRGMFRRGVFTYRSPQGVVMQRSAWREAVRPLLQQTAGRFNPREAGALRWLKKMEWTTGQQLRMRYYFCYSLRRLEHE